MAPCTDPVSSVSGRNSRASNVSVMTGANQSIRCSPQPSRPTDINSGVLSMLKISTDTGDIGALSSHGPRPPTAPRPTHQRRSQSNRTNASATPLTSSSASHHHYAPSQNPRVSSQWDATSTQRHGSLTSMQSMPSSLPPAHGRGKPMPAMLLPIARTSRSSRSFSMTSAPADQPLHKRQSANSLENRRPGLRSFLHVPIEQVSQMPDNRSPLAYPTRLRRPGYRSPSPALSDTYAQPTTPIAEPLPVSRRAFMPPPIQQPCRAVIKQDSGGNASEPRHLSLRSAPRLPLRPPSEALGHGSKQFSYRPPTTRLAYASPSAGAPQLRPLPAELPAPNSGVTPAQSFQAAAPRYSPLHPPSPSAYPPYTPLRDLEPHALRPSPNVAPMVHQMFHNAARMARTLPLRADTPMTDTTAPSSDPPSYRSAQLSSNPPTPDDPDTTRLILESAILDPALLELQDSSSEPVLSARYFEFVEGLDKSNADAELQLGMSHPSVPPLGFVQRVRAMLESKAAANERTGKAKSEGSAGQNEIHELAAETSHVDASELHEMAANETPRFTLIEEFVSPSELPASPVKPPATNDASELDGPVTQRITRDMVKAELGTSSVDNTLDQPEAEDTSHMLIKAERHRGRSSIAMAISAYDPEPTGSYDNTVSAAPDADASKMSSKSDSETASTISIKTNVPSGADYALHFTLHLDTATSPTETYSKDHFGLQIDPSHMLQQQEQLHERGTSRPSMWHSEPRTEQISFGQGPKEPVSPLKAEDINLSRYSAVSPLPTQTLGIDQTLHMALEENSAQQAAEEPSIPGSFPHDVSPPPTPRAAKTHSKSMQLPSSTVTATDTNSTNRYSLPGDLSSIGNSSTNSTTTEMVTDVAVRFSLPHTAPTLDKPQIVDVASSSTPHKPEAHSTPPTSTEFPIERRAAKRSSVTFADKVAPLAISKRPEKQPVALLNSEHKVCTVPPKPIGRKQSPREASHSTDEDSPGNAIDPHFLDSNSTNLNNSRFGSTQLPDLKEESIEDMSALNLKRSSDLTHEWRFPIPARLAAVRAMQDSRLQEAAERAKARRVLRHRNRPLAEIRNLPSLNFSRMDLIDKLNEALDVRATKSLDSIRPHHDSNIFCPSPQRVLGTEPLRERYMSFFNKPTDFGLESELAEGKNDSAGSGEGGEEEEEEMSMHKGGEASSSNDIHESDSDEEGAPPLIHSLSPQQFLSVAHEVNRLSIPSVAGLSERLSELIPGLKNLQSLQLDTLLGSWPDNDDLGKTDDLARPDTILSQRHSTGFRALAERAEDIVRNGTHDSYVSTWRFGVNKHLSLLPASVSADNVIAAKTSNDSKQSYLSGSTSMPTDLGKDVARPVSAHTRDRTPITEDDVRQLLPPEMNPIARATLRSMSASQASSRPWNLEESYPWAASRVDLDLSVPKPAHISKPSMASGTHDKHVNKSLDLVNSSFRSDTAQGIDIGSIVETHESSGSATTEQLTGFSANQLHKQSKRSMMGSISRKLGFGGRCTGEDECTSKTAMSLSPISRPASPTRTSQLAGDRYPTSALAPPAVFNLDEVRSFFSDNSSEGARPRSLRKRLTRFKGGKGKSVRIEIPGGGSGSSSASLNDGTIAYDAGTATAARVAHGITATAATDPASMPRDPGVGMSRTEFHIKRLGEKLRHLLAKGGELFRAWSGHARHPRRPQLHKDDWLADLDYSGI